AHGFEVARVAHVDHAVERGHGAVRGVLEDALGSDAPMVRGAVYLEADICRGDLLVEIEAHATAPGLRRD
uniref:hypothetical protein n=1 Tax=Pseudomonas aeruginosa TaxID=287 RepID=UPI000A6B2BE2